MNKINALLSLLLCLVFFSCQSEEKTIDNLDHLDARYQKLIRTPLRLLESPLLLGNNRLILSPIKQINTHGDLLYVSEYVYSEIDSIIKIVEVSSGNLVKHLAAYGEGPDQVLFSNGLHISKDEVSFLDDTKIILHYWKTNGWDGQSLPSESISRFNANSGLISDALKIGTTVVTVLLEDVNQDGSELAYSHTSNANWKYIDSFPKRTSTVNPASLDKRLIPATYESTICRSKTTEQFAIAYSYTDKIKILDKDSKTRRILVGPDNFDPDFITYETPDGGVAKQAVRGKTKYAWLSIASSNNYLYGLYSGKFVGFEGQPADYKANTGEIVFKIDWKTGEVVDTYRLPVGGSYRIAVSPDDSTLFVGSDDNDTHIDIYTL